MARINIDFRATTEPTAERASFLSHANWLHAFAALAGFGFNLPGGTNAVLSAVATAAAAFPVPNANARNFDAALGCLNRAWGTELILNVDQRIANEDELLRVTNSWGAIQAYYAAYGATQALIVAEGYSRPASHESTQKMAVDLWIARGGRVSPWTFAVGSTLDRRTDPDGTINGPGRPLDQQFSVWGACTPETCWELAEKALRTTREQAVKKRLAKGRQDKSAARRKKWRTEEYGRVEVGRRARRQPSWWNQTPQLTRSDKQGLEKGTRPYTVLDYLYRLRIKANYEDASMFTVGPVDNRESRAVGNDLIRLTSAALIAHEVRLAKLLGTARFLQAADDWVTRNAAAHPSLGLSGRRAVLRQVL